MNIITQVRDFVESECKKPTSKYGYEPFPFHFVPVAKYAQELAEKFDADKEVVVIAAWLHDIGSIMYGRKDHHITSVQIAEQKLQEFGYPQEKIELIKKCIGNHRGSQGREQETIEEQIVCEADVLSAFENVPGLFKAAFIYENLDQGKAKISVREKLQRKYKQLHFEESKKIIEPKYEAAMLLLQ